MPTVDLGEADDRGGGAGPEELRHLLLVERQRLGGAPALLAGEVQREAGLLDAPAGLLPDVPAAAVVVVAQPVGVAAREGGGDGVLVRRVRRRRDLILDLGCSPLKRNLDGRDTALEEQIVAVGAGDRRDGNGDAPALGLEASRRTLGGTHAGGALVVIGEDDDVADVVRDLHPLETLGRERGPDRPPRREMPKSEARLDALAEDERQADDGIAEADRAAGRLAEHHLRLVDPRLRRRLGVEVGAVEADDRAGAVADDPDERRIAGAGVPVREVRVETQVGVVEDLEAPLPKVGLSPGTGDRYGMPQDERNLLGGIPPAWSGRRPCRRG